MGVSSTGQRGWRIMDDSPDICLGAIDHAHHSAYLREKTPRTGELSIRVNETNAAKCGAVYTCPY